MNALRLAVLVILALAGAAQAGDSSSAATVRLLVDGMEVQSDAERPRACVTFSHDLDAAGTTPIEAFVRLEPADDVGISARRNLLCLDGLRHGTTYTLTLLDGLPGVAGRLEGDQSLTLEVPDRTPSTSFSASGFVLPRIDTAGLPVETVNIETLALRLYRVNDRALVGEIRDGMVFGELYMWNMEDLADSSGQEVWSGTMAIDMVENATVRTAIPIEATIGTLEPGIYAVAAIDERRVADDWPEWSSQWFVVSDLGLASYLGESGLDVTVRSLSDGRPLAGVEVELHASNSGLLGTAASDTDGLARFDAGLVRGSGGNAPRIVMVRQGEDFGFLDLASAALDLSDRGVEGRLPPGPLDAFLYSERGIYRPGETAHVVALLRDAEAVAVDGLPLILRVLRPDGVEVSREIVADAGGGSHALDVALPANAYTGMWSVEALADPESPAIGVVTFLVDDFVPPRIEFDLAADPALVLPGVAATTATIDADYLYGGVASGVEGEITLTYAAERDPFDRDDGFQFGLVEEELPGATTEPIAFVTDEAGRAEVPVDLSDLVLAASPIEVSLHAQLFDFGGRPVGRDATLTVLPSDVLIGVRPAFNEFVRWGETATFDVAVYDSAGEPLSLAGLQWDLVRESYDWRWWDEGGNWRYRGFMWDEPVASGSVDADAGDLARIAQGVDWGRYRLEVWDPASGAATSVRFTTGWSRGPVAADTPPDRVTVTLSGESFAPGDTATVFIDPPFDAEVALAVADGGVRELRFVSVPEAGAEIELVVSEDWAPGAYVVATAYGAPDPLAPSIPQRAVGVAWMAVERPGERLDVAIEAPTDIVPEQTVEVTVRVDGVATGAEAYVTLAAVDDGILQLTRYEAPNPQDWFLGQRRLGVALHDIYGRLIDSTGAATGEVRSGGDRLGAGFGDALAKRSSKVVALFSGIVPVVDGVARVPIVVPDFNGRLRLMAVAWSKAGVGQAEATMTVAAPLVADLVLPRFLAPGDSSTAALAIDNVSAPAGSWTFKLVAEGPVSVQEPSTVVADLAQGDRIAAGFRLQAMEIGVARVTLMVTGPDESYSERTWDLAVRAPSPLVTERRVVDLPPDASHLIPASLTADYYAGGLSAALAIDTTPPLDTATLLRWLYLYPYGCAEQTTSTAMPLLYAARLDAEGVLDATAAELSARVDDAIRRLVAMQRGDGEFGRWSWWDDSSVWLNAYVTDFLTRARDAGHFVPASALDRSFQALRRAVDYGSDSATARAYALLVLARNGEGDAYDLAYAADRLGQEGLTQLGRTLLAVVFADLGDVVRAQELVALPEEASESAEAADPFGSRLRDSAMAAALLAESGLATPDRMIALAERVTVDYGERWWTSTQEKAWLVVAANAMRSDAPVAASLDGVDLAGDGPIETALAWPPAEGGALVHNEGDVPLFLSVSWTGHPLVDTPAAADGFTIERRVYDLKGRRIDGDVLAQHDRVVVVLEVEAVDHLQHQALIVDLLPAGIELENARLEGAIDAGELAWLPELAVPLRTELRDDRFVAALDIGRYDGAMRVAYIARAVTPGRYVVPAPFVEDMYRPYLFARGEAGRLDVAAP